MNYTDILIDLREEKNIKQYELAKILNISAKLYNMYETQYKIIPLNYLTKAAEYFGISIDYLLGLSNVKTYNNPNTINKINFSERLKSLRKDIGLSQKAFANSIKISQSIISDLERRNRFISTPFLYQICKKYNISADYLLGKIDEPKYLK